MSPDTPVYKGMSGLRNAMMARDTGLTDDTVLTGITTGTVMMVGADRTAATGKAAGISVIVATTGIAATAEMTITVRMVTDLMIEAAGTLAMTAETAGIILAIETTVEAAMTGAGQIVVQEDRQAVIGQTAAIPQILAEHCSG